jgi:hypothetical protein
MQIAISGRLQDRFENLADLSDSSTGETILDTGRSIRRWPVIAGTQLFEADKACAGR